MTGKDLAADQPVEDARSELLAQPCRCVSCPDCRGSGRTWFQTGGYPEEDVETCDYCSGSGITEQCDRCADLIEIEHDHDPRP
jgi:DnaJ-class molecular chaperone